MQTSYLFILINKKYKILIKHDKMIIKKIIKTYINIKILKY